jgi:hypothetical protein
MTPAPGQGSDQGLHWRDDGAGRATLMSVTDL